MYHLNGAETNMNWNTWGGWLVAAITFLISGLLVHVIRPIREQGVKNEGAIEALRIKQAEQETTLKMYVESQASIQQTLGKIELRLGESVAFSKNHNDSIKRLETELAEIRKLHLTPGVATGPVAG
jgi:hypothetical protein